MIDIIRRGAILYVDRDGMIEYPPRTIDLRKETDNARR